MDCQQRLTTITLLLAVIRNFYRQHSYTDRATGTQNFIGRNDKNNQPTYVLRTETSYPYLQTAIQKSEPQLKISKPNEEEALLEAAFQFFKAKVSDELAQIESALSITDATKKVRIKRRLDELRDTLLSLKLIYVELDNEDDAYQVFETLNTRGKDLATANLIKNHLARLLREKNSSSDDLKLRWSTISENIKAISIEGIDIDVFIYHYWLATNPITQKKEIFKAVRATIKNKPSAKKLLDELVIFSEEYRDLHEVNLRK